MTEITVTKTSVEKYTIIGAKALDPVSVFFEQIGQSQGRIIVECYGSAWATFFNNIGANGDLKDFFVKADNEYLVNRMATKTTKRDIAHLDRIISAIKLATGALSHLSVELGAFFKEQYNASFFKLLYNDMTTVGKLTIFLPLYFLCLFSFVLITPVAAILAPIIFWIERKLEQMPKLFFK